MIIYCIVCFLPHTKPDLYFNDIGKCAACLAFESREEVDWSLRQQEFIKIVESFQNKNSSEWDCIIPVSGGKDSTAQVLKLLELGFNPLCVNATTCDLTPIGRNNIQQTYTVRFRDDAQIAKLFTNDTEKPEIINMNKLFNSKKVIFENNAYVEVENDDIEEEEDNSEELENEEI